MLLEKKFQLQSCSEFDYKQLCNWKYSQNIVSLAVARGVWLQLVTIATKLIQLTDQIIASLYLKYLYNQMISLEDMVSSSFVVFARNVLYSFTFLVLFCSISVTISDLLEIQFVCDRQADRQTDRQTNGHNRHLL